MKIFADNLSRPVTSRSQFRFGSETHKVSVRQIQELDFQCFAEARQALAERMRGT